MPCVSGCLKENCACAVPGNCIIRIRSLYRGGFEFKINPETTSQQCILQATKSMGIPDDGACYFGLQHESYGERYWLVNNKSIFAQLTATATPCKKPGEKRLHIILLRIRFFGVPESLLDNDVFRTFLFYQLKGDFTEGRLTRNAAELASLAAYILHYGSLTILSLAFPGIDLEKKLKSALPKQILSVKPLVPYVQLALKVISNLTAEQTKLRFISQCQLLSHYGVERFAASLAIAKVPYLVYFSSSGVVVERSHIFSKTVTEWDLVSKICANNEVLEIEFHPRLTRHGLSLVFSSPESAQRACESALTQQNMALSKLWKKPPLHFQPLIHVPHSLLQFNGESDKLSAAIQDIFAYCSDSPRVKNEVTKENNSRNSAFFRYASDANIYCECRPREMDVASERASEQESTFPLIYGSILAQSTPVLRHHSLEHETAAKCVSAVNLPHKKRLAASRPLVNNSTVMVQSTTSPLLFSSQPSINQTDWAPVTASLPQVRLSHPHLARRISDIEVTNRTSKNLPSYSSSLAESDRCSSLVFPRSISSDASEEKDSYHVTKYRSECGLYQKTPISATPAPCNCDLEESADDLAALPTKSNIYLQSKTLPARFKRRNIHISHAMCLELVQKLRHRQELEQEYSALPSPDLKDLKDETCIDLGLPVRFLVWRKNVFESEEFWNNSPNIVVILGAKFLEEKIFQPEVVAGSRISIGQQVILSIFSPNRSPNCHTFGVHVKTASNHKTVWLFCWLGEISTKIVPEFASFVDEIVATDITRTAPSLIAISASSESLSLCSLYIVAHVLLRTFRVSNCSPIRTVFDAVATIRRLLPQFKISFEEYSFLYELLLRWLEKPPRLI